MTNTKSVLVGTLKHWLPLGISIVILTGLIHVTVQQNYRMNANDPQVQIAEDVTSALNTGLATPDNIVSPQPTTDIASSLAPFVAVFSATGTPVGSSVSLNGKLPTLPSGVFDKAKQAGGNRFTWEPQKGVRIAAVVMKFSSSSSSGYVLAGRSLKEIEKREQDLLYMTLIAGVAVLVLSFLATWFAHRPAAMATPEAATPEKHI